MNVNGSPGKPYFTIDGHQISDDGGQVVYRKHRDGREEYFPEGEEPGPVLEYEIGGSTGFSPSGVSYESKDLEGLGRKPVRQRRFNRPRLLKGKHPHV